MAAEKTLFPELAQPSRSHRGKQRDPFGRYDTRGRFEAYERKIERLRGKIKYLANITSVHADAIRRRDEEIRELKFQLNGKTTLKK